MDTDHRIKKIYLNVYKRGIKASYIQDLIFISHVCQEFLSAIHLSIPLINIVKEIDRNSIYNSMKNQTEIITLNLYRNRQ